MNIYLFINVTEFIALFVLFCFVNSARERSILMTTLYDMDTALVGHLIETKLVSDVDECARSCFDVSNCFSFNLEYAAGGMKTCELNHSTKELAEASIVKRRGFVYYG